MTEYRFDEDFDGFLEDFGEPHDCTPITDEVIEAYRNKLPEQLFRYWRSLGACGFHNGLIWMVNPADYQDLLDSWLEGSLFENRHGLSVIARSAFGELYVWGKNKGDILDIDPLNNIISIFIRKEEKSVSNEKEDFLMRCFWGFQDKEDIDLADKDNKPLFDRALKKLGQLKSDEMYGFSHRLALGGKETLDNLEIVKLDVYHDLAQQMEPPQIIKI
jgi:hypothetical protein